MLGPMAFEVWLAGTAAVLTAWALTRRHALRLQLAATSAAVALCAAMALVWNARASVARMDDALARHRPSDRTLLAGSRWASSRQCVSCHPAAHASWSRTFHRTMTQPATPSTVLARWQGMLEHHGRRYYLMRRGEQFWVDMPAYGTTGEGAGERMLRPVVMTTGSHHQQLYWLPLPWAELPADGEGARLFEARCASCHGRDGIGGSAGPLRLMELYPPAIRAAYQRHLAAGMLAPLDETAAEKLLAHAARLQLDDRLMQFPFAWLVRDQRWVHEDHTFIHPEPEPDAVEPYDEGWSNSCDGCHAVGSGFREDFGPDYGDAWVAELGIGCEACHGAGAAHVARHRDPLRRYLSHWREAPPDDIVLPTRLDPARSAAVCGQCHAETWPYDEPHVAYRPGARLEDHTRVVQWQPAPYPPWLARAVREDGELMSSGFWRDGTIRIAGRDYNGLAISPCHIDGGLRCTDCHSMHAADPDDQLAPEARGDAVCLGCHASVEPAAHSHHESVTCQDCHMPRTTLGLLTVMRAHRIDSPSARTAAETGRPIACALCHLDRTPRAIAEDLARWYGHPVPEGLDDRVASAVRLVLSGDAVQRAVVAWHFGWPEAQRASTRHWQAPLLAQLLDDPYPAVRYIAGHALRTLPGYDGFDYDYVGDPASRRAAVQRALSAFRVQATPPPATLVGHEGWTAAAALLLLARDDRPVSVNE